MKIPKLLVGATGIGKTEMTEAKYDYVEKLLTSSMVEEDIAGLIYREGAEERRTIPAFIQRIKKAVANGKKTCLFLDEVDKGRREVVDTLLTLITHQENYGIPKEVDIVLACNPPEWGGGDGISIPLLNRVSVINVVPDISSWCDWIKSKYSHPFVDLVVERVESGEIPLLETTGEHLERRITSPRSLTHAIDCYLTLSPNEAREMSDGMLTPNVSSSLYVTFMKTQKNVEEKHFRTNLKATSVASNYKVFRKGI